MAERGLTEGVGLTLGLTKVWQKEFLFPSVENETKGLART